MVITENSYKRILGNHTAEIAEQLVNDIVISIRKAGLQYVILKFTFMVFILLFYPSSLSIISDEHGERLHQDVNKFEERFQGRWYTTMLGDYCWCLKRDDHAKRLRKILNFKIYVKIL